MTTIKNRQLHVLGAVALATALLLPTVATALPPTPANDDPASAEVIGPAIPVMVFATLEGAANDLQDTGLPDIGAGNDDGPDVFFDFTPSATDTYRIQLVPWQHAPLRYSSTERRFVIYIGTDFDTVPVYIDGLRAGYGSRPVHMDVALNMGTTYTIGVDHNAATRDNCSFTLIIDTIPAVMPDACASAETIPTTLPYAVVNDIDGAAADFTYDDFGSGRCAVRTATNATGIDHVYKFTPTVDGDYAFELISQGFDGVLYIDDSCDPFTLDGCVGASHNSGGSDGYHDLVVATLEATKDYYIFVDEDDGTNDTGNYVLIVDDAFNYEMNEIEPNETPAGASPITTPLNGGQLLGPLDVDWFAVTGLTGDRVYAWANNGGRSNTTIDLDMGFYATDGVTLIEFDDEDADSCSADATYEDLTYIYSTSSPVIAGAAMTADGTHFLNVWYQSTSTHVVHRYRLHVGVEPASRLPLPECEPNNTLGTADYSGKHYYAGVIDTTTDADFYAFDATAGDRVFIAFDGDPERDADGFITANSDPNAFHGKLLVYDPDQDVIYSDISDSNSIQSGPDYPAQGGFFVARATGTHYVEVKPQSTSSQVGPTETYELAIFLNDAAPALTEDVDPILTLTPDDDNDLIDVTATDNAGGDTGICDAWLVDATNVQVSGLVFTPGDGSVSFQVTLVDGMQSGAGKLFVEDCAGNTACAMAAIDVDPPVCSGANFSARSPVSLHDPIHVPDYETSGPGIDGTIDVAEAGIITKITVTMSIETLGSSNIDCWLESPTGTRVELITDRGSSSGVDITDATFDDDADESFPGYSGTPPYTGTWLPDDAAGLAQLNSEQAQGRWKLNVVDDSSSPGGGSRLVEWSMVIKASFGAPETYAGTATDTLGLDSGIASVVLTDVVNTQLDLSPEFVPGDTEVSYSVSLIDTSVNGSGTLTVTDLGGNTCVVPIALLGAVDGTGPSNSGAVTTDLQFGAEVQAVLPIDSPTGATSSVNVGDSTLVGEVEVELTIDTKDTGRITSTLTHGGDFASLLNRTGMDDRFSVGLTKDGGIELILDDDAPEADDTHLEPAAGSIEFLGLHQPDGRGEFIFNGITTDDRDHMLFGLAGADSSGSWDLFVADYRPGYSTTTGVAIFRRWSATIKNPCAADRYVGTTMDAYPGTGICSIALAGGATNLAVAATFTPGDEIVDYVVTLTDPALPGSGTLEITDCATNVTTVPISLAAAGIDQSPPVIGGMVNPVSHEFAGTASDNEVDDTGIEVVEMAPYADNLQIVSMAPDPPNGASHVSFVIALVDPMANGRGYVRVVDGCGLRGYALVEIDALSPVCTGSTGHTQRYLSTDLPQVIPNNNPAGVSSDIVVTDIDTVEDVNITFNILHPNASDIDMTLTSPMFIDLFSDRGSTGNDFIDVTLDDEAAEVIPSSYTAAPFTGSWQPETGSLSTLDGVPAVGTYTLKVADDYSQYPDGTFESWALTIESSTFPDRYDGRAEDGETHDSGICTIELLPGADNLTLAVDPFDPGDAIVRYSVALTDPSQCGSGAVRVTDCVGNVADVPVELGPRGDVNEDGNVDFDDVAPMVDALLNGGGCEADVNKDGVINGDDIQWFVDLVIP